MICVQLLGGLGNQMFQYAMGRRVADGLGVELKLDVTPFRAYTLREYELGDLCIQAEPASDEELERLRVGRPSAARRLAHKALPAVRREPANIYRERMRSFDPAALAVRDGAYLIGYWQSEQYFAPVAQRLRAEFLPRQPLTGRLAELAGRAASVSSVSVHVRRGDYVSDPATRAVHHVCDADYYARCVRYVTERVEAAELFVFTDEPGWVRENLPLGCPTTFVHTDAPGRPSADMLVMSRCRHHIIANSSFSWWGAWLSSDPAGIVLMPRRWFRDQDPDDSAYIRPHGWIPL